jgi:hypothetical protein
VIEVFEASAEDGSPLHTVSVPVTLMPWQVSTSEARGDVITQSALVTKSLVVPGGLADASPEARLSLELREAAPNAVGLAHAEGILEAFSPDAADGAHSLGAVLPVPSLGRGFTVVHAKEQDCWIREAGGLLPPRRIRHHHWCAHLSWIVPALSGLVNAPFPAGRAMPDD